MAYENIISILIAAKDEASKVLESVALKTKAAAAETNSNLTSTGSAAESAGNGLAKIGLVAGIAAVAIGVVAVKAAGDFQSALVRLTTSAGESSSNLKLVGDGVLQIARDTGTSTTQLTNAMYLIESAGLHGADGLIVLKAAAQGAKAENADVATVANAVSSALQDYHLKATDAAMVTSKFITAIGDGKTNFQDFASSLSAVLPIASAAHVSLSDVVAAIASMTVHGMSADQSTQDLAHTIEKMQSPTQAMTKYLSQIGISSQDLATSLGTKGITGTLQDISQAIMAKMGPAGRVLIDSFNQSKSAAEDANKMIASMPTNLQSLAKEFQNGSLSAAAYHKEVKALPTTQSNLMTQFSTLQNKASGFNDLLKSGSPEAKTYAAALAAATGDATSLNTALMLTGDNTAYVNKAVKDVNGSTTEAGSNVRGWSAIQDTFNFKLSQFGAAAQTSAIALGEKLLPVASALITGIMDFNNGISASVDWLGKHQAAVTVAASVLGVLFGPALVGLALVAAATGVKVVASAAMSGAAWIGNAAKMSLQWELELAKIVVGGATTVVKTVAQAVVISGKWVAEAAVTSGAWVITELPKIVAAGSVTAVKSAISAADTSLAWTTNAVRVSLVWVTQEMPKLAVSFTKTAASATVQAAITSKQWVISATKTSAVWVVTELPKIVTGFIATKTSATLQAGITSAKWIASSTKTSAAWVITALPKIIAGFAIASGSAIAQAAITSGAWVASAVTSSASYGAFAALVATPLVMPAIVVAAAIGAIMTVYQAVQSVIGALNSMNQLAASQASSKAASQSLIQAANKGLAAGRITKDKYNHDVALANQPTQDVSWFDKLLTGHFATGTSFAPGGLAMVGENGPELVNLPRGSQVYTNSQSQKMAGGGSPTVSIGTWNNNSNMDEQKFLKSLGWKLSLA